MATLGFGHARWLIWAAPAFVALGAPMLATGRVRSVAPRHSQRTMALLCVGVEGSCVGVGAWFPHAERVPAVLLPSMWVAALIAVYLAGRGSDDARWRAAFAGLPCLFVPFAGLERNPTQIPALVACAAAAGQMVAFARWPRAGEGARRWGAALAPRLAPPALLLVLLLPWHFRDVGVADMGGHEGQHLGWINSMTFGKLMMADAGLTYGPAREYLLAATAWIMGGLTLEHVRLAHVALNLVGLLCIFEALRRVCAGQIHAMLLGLALVAAHTALGSFVVYTRTYSFGWADACRAGLPTLAIVLALTRSLDGSRRAARQLVGAAALVGLAILYSHDYGAPAAVGLYAGLLLEVLVRRRHEPVRARLGAFAKAAALASAAIAVVLAAFVLVYAVHGKAGALVEGYRWTFQVSSGRVAFVGREWQYGSAFDSFEALTRKAYEDDSAVVSRALDYVLGPGLAALGLAHVAASLFARRVTQRTTVVLALSVLTAAAMHHAFLAADPWHMQNASTPGLVVLFALGAGGRRIALRGPGRRPIAAGVLAAALLPVLWFLDGGLEPINMRLARIASGEERPSTGEPYRYPDLPRAGDLGIGPEHLEPVRWIRRHSSPDDPVFCATWLLGGGTETFLAQRRNPTSFDKPDEVAGAAQVKRQLAELQRDLPKLIAGHFFDYMDDATRRYIDANWHKVNAPRIEMLERNAPPLRSSLDVGH